MSRKGCFKKLSAGVVRNLILNYNLSGLYYENSRTIINDDVNFTLISLKYFDSWKCKAETCPSDLIFIRSKTFQTSLDTYLQLYGLEIRLLLLIHREHVAKKEH